MKLLGVIATVTYPFLIYAGLHLLEPRPLAVLAGGLMLARAAARGRLDLRELRPLAGPAIAIAVVLGATAALDDGRFLLFTPAVASGALLIAFARTLRRGPTIVERFARSRHHDLSTAEVAHCRRVTVAWCVFFSANATIVLWLALTASLEAWTLYTGLLSYLVMGLMFLAEFLYRKWRFRRYEGGVVDSVLERLFPPEPPRPDCASSDRVPSEPLSR